MLEEQIAQDMMNAWIAMELVGCGYPVKSPEDVKGLQYAVAQTEVSIVTSDVKKIAALKSAINVFIAKYIQCRDEVIEAALTLALALQVAAQDTLDTINHELHLERTSS